MSVSRSVIFDSDMTRPMDTVLISTGGNACPLLQATADAASIAPCLILYRSASTYANEMTQAGAVHGDDALLQDLYVCEIDPSSNAIARDGTEYDNAYADLDSIKVYQLKEGMEFWAKASNLTCDVGEMLTTAANGLLTNVGDPDGVAIDIACPAFMALAAGTGVTYVPVRYLGRRAFDKTG